MPASGFPVAVLTVNLVGGFVLGWLLARRERAVVPGSSTTFWSIGVLGSFTTFSALSVDTVELLHAGRGATAALYVAASVVGGLLLAHMGQRLGAAS